MMPCCWSWYAISLLLIDPDPKNKLKKTPAKSSQQNTPKTIKQSRKQAAPAQKPEGVIEMKL